MPPTSANSFVSSFKNYRVYYSDINAWSIETRLTKRHIGIIKYIGEGEWLFMPLATEFNHLQLLEIAHAVKTVEKWNLPGTASLYKK
jgi:hypothetical protein